MSRLWILLGFFVLLALLLRPIQSGASSWLPGWAYRVPVIVHNESGSLTNYPVRVVLNTSDLISQGKLRPDCADLRITDASGTVLPIWLESGCGDTNTILWVRVFELPSGDTTLYLYYGNPTAQSIFDPYTVFPYFVRFGSDYNGMGDWTCGRWDYSGPQESSIYCTLYADRLRIRHSNWGAIWRQASLSPFQLLEANVAITDPQFWFFIGVLREDWPNRDKWPDVMALAGTNPRYHWSTFPDNAIGGFVSIDDGSWYGKKYWRLVGIWEGISHVLGVTGCCESAAFFCYDENCVYSTTPTDPLPVHYQGIFVGDYTDLDVYWVRIRPFHYPEPTVSLGPEEPALIPTRLSLSVS